MFRRSYSVKDLKNKDAVIESHSKSTSSIHFPMPVYDSFPKDEIENVSTLLLANKIKTELLNQILQDPKYVNKYGALEAKNLIASHISHIWEKNIAILCIAQNDVAIIYTREAPSASVKLTGKKVNDKYTEIADPLFISDLSNPVKGSFYGSLDDSSEVLIDDFLPTIYILSNYHTNDKNLHNPKSLANAINYFIVKNKWDVVIYLEDDLGVQANIDRKNKWILDNSTMLHTMSQQYGNKFDIINHNDIKSLPIYGNAELMFIKAMTDCSELFDAMKSEVNQQLNPVTSQRFIASALKKSKKTQKKEVSFQNTYQNNIYQMDSLVADISRSLLNPDIPSAEKKGLKMFLDLYYLYSNSHRKTQSKYSNFFQVTANNSANLIAQENYSNSPRVK